MQFPPKQGDLNRRARVVGLLVTLHKPMSHGCMLIGCFSWHMVVGSCRLPLLRHLTFLTCVPTPQLTEHWNEQNSHHCSQTDVWATRYSLFICEIYCVCLSNSCPKVW